MTQREALLSLLDLIEAAVEGTLRLDTNPDVEPSDESDEPLDEGQTLATVTAASVLKQRTVSVPDLPRRLSARFS